MIKWRDVRSQSDLTGFLDWFEQQSTTTKDLILTEMLGVLEAHKTEPRVEVQPIRTKTKARAKRTRRAR